ncbi:MAG: HK97 gp10 family phage protein [Eubacterium sp.]|nr:HK97 gp10 family phage protein [Eubacterium sp.]
MLKGITFRHKGDFSKTEKFFHCLLKLDYLNVLERYGRAGVSALASVTPKESGLTAASWNYEISHNAKETAITFTNSNIHNGVNIAIILQYGHGTGHGGYVAGRDYINPAIQPIFDKIAEDAWREVTNL